MALDEYETASVLGMNRQLVTLQKELAEANTEIDTLNRELEEAHTRIGNMIYAIARLNKQLAEARAWMAEYGANH